MIFLNLPTLIKTTAFLLSHSHCPHSAWNMLLLYFHWSTEPTIVQSLSISNKTACFQSAIIFTLPITFWRQCRSKPVFWNDQSTKLIFTKSAYGDHHPSHAWVYWISSIGTLHPRNRPRLIITVCAHALCRAGTHTLTQRHNALTYCEKFPWRHRCGAVCLRIHFVSVSYKIYAISAKLENQLILLPVHSEVQFNVTELWWGIWHKQSKLPYRVPNKFKVKKVRYF